MKADTAAPSPRSRRRSGPGLAPSGEPGVADPDLRKDAGVETLNRRVEAEARRICNVGETNVRGAADDRSCVVPVLASAKPQVDRVVANARR